MAVHDSADILTSSIENNAILERSAIHTIYLVPSASAYTGSVVEGSIFTNLREGFAASIVAHDFVGTGITWTIQESPDPKEVADDVATWFDLETFATLTGAGSEKIAHSGSHFSRIRASGSAAAGDSGSFTLIIEGEHSNI